MSLTDYIISMVRENVVPSNETIKSVCLALMTQVSYLHGLHITHNDIKPDNIIVSKDPNGYSINHTFLIDYGEACLTEKCFFGGTPMMWSPEHIKRPGMLQENETLKTYDIWALGVTMYILCNNGLYPYPERNYYLYNTGPQNSLESSDPSESIDSSDSMDFPLDIDFPEDSKEGVSSEILSERLLNLNVYSVYKANNVQMSEIQAFFDEGNTPKSSMSLYEPINKIINLMLIVDPNVRPNIHTLLEYYIEMNE
jgi:serine/threonine protein kinase